MSTIKVLHVIARMNVGGTARYVGDLVEKIPESALATGFVQASEIEDPVSNALMTFRVPHLGRKISPINDFRAWLELRKIIREVKPQIIHTHTFKAGLIGRLVGGNHKHVHTFHGHLFDDQSFSLGSKIIISVLERYLATRTDVLISVGMKVGQDLRSAGIGTNKKWISIAPGVTGLTKIDKKEARNLLGLKPDVFLFGWMARMTGVKNPHLMLNIARKMPNVSFVMAGGGDLLEQVNNVAPNNVAIIGWADAATFWSAVDCALSTSDNEGMPIALIEAQIAGVPVIATNVGSNAEVVENGITGIVTDKNINSLIESINIIRANDSLLKSMSKSANVMATQKFSPAKLILEHEKIYKFVLKPNEGRT